MRRAAAAGHSWLGSLLHAPATSGESRAVAAAVGLPLGGHCGGGGGKGEEEDSLKAQGARAGERGQETRPPSPPGIALPLWQASKRVYRRPRPPPAPVGPPFAPSSHSTTRPLCPLPNFFSPLGSSWGRELREVTRRYKKALLPLSSSSSSSVPSASQSVKLLSSRREQ